MGMEKKRFLRIYLTHLQEIFQVIFYMSAVEMRKLIKDLNLKKKLIGEFLYYLCDKKRVQEEKYYLDIMLEEMVLKKI